jgi:hypothetical protein
MDRIGTVPILLRPSRGAGFGSFAPIPNEARIGTESDANRAHLRGQYRPLGVGLTAQARTIESERLNCRPALTEATDAQQNDENSARRARHIQSGECGVWQNQNMARHILVKPRAGAGFKPDGQIFSQTRMWRESGALTGAIQALGSGFNGACEDSRK